MVNLLPKTFNGLAVRTPNEQLQPTGWEAKSVEEMGREGQGNPGSDPQLESFGLKSSREDRFEEAIPDDISPSFNSILYMVTEHSLC